MQRRFSATAPRSLSFLKLLFALVFVLIHDDTARAQRPEGAKLALDFRGPVGKTRVVGFLRSGKRFFAAGENKVVQLYDLAAGTAVPGNVVRWEFSRGALGEINSVSLASDEKRLAIAGSSLRGAGGDIVITDFQNQEVHGLLRAGSGAAVTATAISRDGSTVVSSDRLGNVVLWRSQGEKFLRQPLLESSEVTPDGADVNRTFNPVLLVNDTIVVYFAPLLNPDSISWQLTAFDTATNSGRAMTDVFDSVGTGLGASADGSVIIASSSSGQLSVRREGMTSQPTLLEVEALPGDEAGLGYRVRNVAVSPDGRFFAVMGDYERRVPEQSFLAIYVTSSLQPVDRVQFSGLESCVTAAFDPSGELLLSHDDSKEELLVWKLRDGQRVVMDRPLSNPGNPPLTVGGRGRIFREARFNAARSSTETGYQLFLEDVLNRETSIFLGDGALEETADVADADRTLNGPDSFAPGWSIQADEPSNDKLTQNLFIVPPTGVKSTWQPITFRVPEQGIFSSAYAFIQDPAGKPSAVAIGTRTIDGIFIYTIPSENGGEPKLIRYFRDHSGLISDLSVSTDQKYLASCSPDKTVKIWSLAGLDRPAEESVPGARVFLDADQKVRIQDLIKAGVFYSRGLRDDDVIVRAASISTGEELLEQPEDIARLINSHPAYAALDLWTERTGTRFSEEADDVIRLNTGWEPLLTLVSDKTSEWVLFTPEGYFDASIAEGDRLFGWQINQGADKPPRFEPAEHLQKDFERPEVIRQLLRVGNVPDALASLNRPAAGDLREDLRSKVLALPKVEITSPVDGSAFDATTPVVVRARVTFADPSDAGKFEILAGQSGRSLPQQSTAVRGSEVDVTWQAQDLDATNVISVVAREKGSEISGSYQSRAEVTVFARRKERSPDAKVYLLAFAVDHYMKTQALNYSVSSVSSFEQDLSSASGLSRQYGALSKVLKDEEVTWSSVTATLTEFLRERAKSASPDDLIIVVICGRGVSRSVARGGSARISLNEEFFFLPYNVDQANLRQLSEQGIRWKDVCDPINAIECDVLWIVDAGHSAQARHEAKSAFSECRGSHGRHVIFADQTEPVEASTYRVRKSDAGNTALMAAIREALIGNEMNSAVTAAVKNLWSDESLTFDELAGYSQPRASELAKKIGKTEKVIVTPKAPSSQMRPLILGSGTFVPAAED